jgi:tetratricopeptide (TPR) repeat protein
MRLAFWRRAVDPAAELRAGQEIEARVAREVPFEQRGPHLARAVERYLAAAAAAPIGSPLWLDATFAAGSLLAGENSVRDLDRAIALLEAVVTTVDGYHPAHYYLGEAYAMAARFDDAERIWRRGLALDPSQRPIADVLRNLGLDRVHAAAKLADHTGVIAAAERVPEPERPAEMWLLLGDAYAALDAPTEAAAAWRRAMGLEPLKGMRRRFRSVGLLFPGDEGTPSP